jgi:HEAT repeat protein
VDVRKEAAEALGKIGDERAIEPLTQALRDSDVRKIAKEALEKIKTKKS